MSLIRAGLAAPNFSLTDQSGEVFTLSTALRKRPVVLVFYPLGGSPNCDRLLCRINNELEAFNEAGITIVGINFADPIRHHTYAAKRYMKLPLLSDSTYQVANLYDSLFTIGPIRAIRYSVVGIGQEGIVKFFQHGRPSNAEIIAAMTAAKQSPAL